MRKYLSKIKYCFKTFESETKGFAFIPWLVGAAIISAVGYLVGGKILEIAGDIVAWFMQEVVAGIANAIMTLAGLLLDHAIKFSLNYNLGDLAAVKLGWTITRDLANLSFIFIILYIAIATILQLSGYGMKDLLVKVVIIALLVNFSLLITKVVIDSSNILAMEFYTAMSVDQGSVSEHIAAGLEIEKVYRLPSGAKLSPLIAIKVAFFSTILYLMTAYVFFGGVFLFVARMVIFIFLMALAPIAFVSMILPKTKDISQRWWKTLFEQSFVAPAYLFFIYVVVKIINDGVLKIMIDKTKPDEVLSVPMVLNFIILIGLMYASLKVAREVGGQISVQALSLGDKIRGVAQGYAGRVAKRYTAPLAEAAVTGEGKGRITRAAAFVGRGLQRVPFGAKALARAEKWDQPEIKKYEKTYGSYSDTALKNIMASPRLNIVNRAQRQAIENIEKKRKKKTEEEEILKIGTSMDKVKILAKREKEAREEAESKLKEKETEKGAIKVVGKYEDINKYKT